MTPGEWSEWRRLNPVRLAHIRGTRIAARPCEDCPLGFAADMRAQDKCNGEPGYIAGEDDEEEEEHTVAEQSGSSQVVSVTAPCGTCSHAPVCRLRAAVEGARTASVDFPRVDAAITVEVAATVSCAHYSGQRQAKATGTDGKRHLSPEGYAAVVAGNRARAERRMAEKAAASA
jgi:hypothetical protein